MMEDQLKRLKTSLRLSAIVVILSGGFLITTHRLNGIRTVDFIQIFVCGIGFGVMLVTAVMLKKLRDGKDN